MQSRGAGALRGQFRGRASKHAPSLRHQHHHQQSHHLLGRVAPHHGASLACRARAEAEETDNSSSIFQRAMKVARSRSGVEPQSSSSPAGSTHNGTSTSEGGRGQSNGTSFLQRKASNGGGARQQSSAKTALSRLRSEGGGLSLFQARKKLAKVKFQVRYKTQLGQHVRVVGSTPELGAWDVAKAPQLKYSVIDHVDGIWSCDVRLPCGQIYEYKYVMCNDQGVPLQWQQGNNALLAVGIRDALAQQSSGGEMCLEVLDRWSGPEGSTVIIKKGDQVVSETTREHRLTSWIRDVEDQLEQGAVQVKELQLELASAKQELMSTRQEAIAAKEESQRMKEMALQSNDKYLLALKEKEKALRQKELVLRQLQLERFESQEDNN
mmetsp:Transcript_36434/g.79002  ORF Transcript_36434/g.79002 Transcript_36434/m.79002 type:complete len:380 (+) Transcript_36434:92-1231(+)